MKVSILGGSGYVGGELLRLLLDHPGVEVGHVTSERLSGKPVARAHPNLRKRTKLRFSPIEDAGPSDLVFSALPHGSLMGRIDEVLDLAPRIIDLSSDFRLDGPVEYERAYGQDHLCPELLSKFIYGIVELHRDEIAGSDLVSSAGCNATATILPLYPLISDSLVDLDERIVSEAKCGSSESGNKSTPGSHHPVRSGCVRSYKPVGHRHIAEMVQELGIGIDFSATALDMVRGILSTSHLRLNGELEEKEVWRTYRAHYGEEPFIRMVNERHGIYRQPEPKLLSGTNYCDIGFAIEGRRIVVLGAIDNLMKGAAGQAVHAMNVMYGFDERMGLEFGGMHPI